MSQLRNNLGTVMMNEINEFVYQLSPSVRRPIEQRALGSAPRAYGSQRAPISLCPQSPELQRFS
jgi:hypothetical protein